MTFWKFIKNVAKDTEPENAELRIEGEIIDDDDMWIAELFGINASSPNSFRAELAKYDGLPLTIWIDSYGGSVFAATGIYNAIKERKGAVNVKIDGKAMSAATIIAMAGNNISMSPTSIFMIHDPLTEVYGYAADLRKVADILDEVKEAIMNAYELKTGRTRDDISALMTAETYMSAQTAIEEKFADEMLYAEGPDPAVKNMSFARMGIMANTAEAIKRMVALQRPFESLTDLPVDPKDPPIPDNQKELALLALELEL